MTNLDALRAEAAQARAAAAQEQRVAAVPDDAPVREACFPVQMRAEKTTIDGKDFFRVRGFASVYERGYDMWDQFGPYTEVVSTGAGSKSLAAKPMVVYRFNHGGMAMATTANGRLLVEEREEGGVYGLWNEALVNPQRSDVSDLLQAIEDQDVTEQSFMFMIERGVWSPDYTEYRIEQYNIDRGDVGPVTYGANPHTSVAARSGEWLAMAEKVSRLARREAIQVLMDSLGEDDRGKALAGLTARFRAEFPDPHEIRSTTPAPAPEKLTQGRSVALALAELLSDTDI